MLMKKYWSGEVTGRQKLKTGKKKDFRGSQDLDIYCYTHSQNCVLIFWN